MLACTNCNSTKGDTQVDLNNYIWPDRDNTYRAFSYTAGVVNSVPGVAQAEADRMIKLVGLDKTPNESEASDRRWLNRLEAWDIAQRAKDRLADTISRTTDQQIIDALRNQIVDTAKSNGHWSIWMTHFQNDPVMLQLLITAFPGTCQTCFDC